jgi:hypothetical protein
MLAIGTICHVPKELVLVLVTAEEIFPLNRAVALIMPFLSPSTSPMRRSSPGTRDCYAVPFRCVW